MSTLNSHLVCEFANSHIVRFHEARLNRLQEISLAEVLRKKNPYLFKAKDINKPCDLIAAILNAFLSSSEEELFGQFLEQLAIFISAQTFCGRKSSAQGLDLEFDREGIRYIVAVKSGPNWGNSSQYRRLEADFKAAVSVLRQGQSTLHVQSVLGICYGRGRPRDRGVYRKIMGQGFWHFLSGDRDLYIDIIEPIGYRARQHNDDFLRRKDAIETRLTSEFIERFCTTDYAIDWPKLVAFNSGNLE